MARFLKFFISLLFLCVIALLIFYVKKNSSIETILHEDVAPSYQALLLPHLEVAKNDRVEFLKQIKATEPSDVIILSTNHFDSSNSDVVYDNSSWTMAGGKVNGSKIGQEFSQYEKSHDLIVNDHGIRNPIIDLSARFPASNFLSFIIKPKSNADVLNKLEVDIEKFCQENSRKCLFVASVDLSHDNLSQIADLHDEFTLSALKKMDESKAMNAETDSPEVLSLFIKWSNARQLKNFKVFSSGNTGKKSGNFDAETTSWIVGGYETGEDSVEKNTTVMVAGDIMTDRLVNHKFKGSGFEKIFSNFGNRVFRGVDSSIANLEGPISALPIEDNISTDNLIFNMPIASLDALKSVGFSGFSLANNHTLNDSITGLDRTRKILSEKGFFPFGSPDRIDDFSIHRLDTDIPLSLIGLNQLSQFNEDELKSLISREKEENRFVIVYPHWGAEYQTSHNTAQQALAHELINWGADLIVGSHPHVIQDSEIYNGKLIVYSLGNFIFDQLFSDETQQGVILNLLIKESRIKIGFTPVVSKNMQVEVLKGEGKQRILDRIIPISGYLNKEENGTIELER